MSLPIEFSTIVNSAGYCWLPTDLDRGRRRASVELPAKQLIWELSTPGAAHWFLTPVTDRERELLSAEPLASDSALFLNFVQLRATPDAVLSFANQHGQLWNSGAEPFWEWAFEIQSMAFMYFVWVAVANGRPNMFINEYFKKSTSGEIAYPFARDMLGYRMFGGRVASPEFPSAGKGRPLEVARDYLEKVINVRLAANEITTALTNIGGSLQLSVHPTTLLGAMWAQFAIAVSENKQYRSCEICWKYFELDPGLNRISRLYCSDACRVKAHRARKAEAKRMRAEGKTLKQVAAALDSDTETIQGWLKPRGE